MKVEYLLRMTFFKITALKHNMQPNKLEEVPQAITKRKVFPRKRMSETIKEEIQGQNSDSHLPKRISKFRSSLLHALKQDLIQNSPCGRTKNISDCRGVVRQLSKVKGPLQSASIARFTIFGPCTFKQILATLCD